MKGMILAAGFGTRLEHFTSDLPKALVPFNGVPMINYQIDRLKSAGISEIIINTHHHSSKMQEYFNNNNFGVKIYLVIENEILGTGGGILNAAQYLKNENFFVVINVDVHTNFDLKKLINFHKQNHPFASLAVQKRKSSRKLEFTSKMELIDKEKDISKVENLWAFNGIHVISNKIFHKNYEVKFNGILEMYFKEIKDNKEIIFGYDVKDSIFKDLGTIKALQNSL